MHDDTSSDGPAQSQPIADETHASAASPAADFTLPRAYEFLNDDSVASRRISFAMVCVAGLALLAGCLLTSPSRFSPKHEADTTWLKPVVTTLGLMGKYGTTRGVEVRQLIFLCAAAMIAMLGGLRLILARRNARVSFDDLLDLRRRIGSPYFWLTVLLLTSFFTTIYSNAASMCEGQLLMRLFHAAWWMPLGALLAARHVRSLAAALLTALSLTAALGLWYYFVRVYPDEPFKRLGYPIGNELWMAACLLPGIFVALGLGMGRFSPVEPWCISGRGAVRLLLCAAAVALVGATLYYTRSRSAQVGSLAGLFTVLCFVGTRWTRRIVLLAGVVAALGASLWLHRALDDSASSSRIASIRSRLEHEWPYALHLFLQKPFAGNGDGAYAMLAGNLARDEQLDDPATIRFDEWSWPGHAHNEILENLADLGLVGTIAYLAMLVLIIRRALQFCDRCSSASRDQRWLAIGLAGALVALFVDQCLEPSVREPGLPPIFLTVWACLWALARAEQPVSFAKTDDNPGISVHTLKWCGAVILTAALWLGWRGAQDWRGAIARYEASNLLDGGDYTAASDKAEFAGRQLLDPFQRAQARMLEVWARSLIFDRALAATEAAPTAEQMKASDKTLERLVQLNSEVPRFLRLSRIAAELHLNRARAFHRLGEREKEQDAQIKFISALLANQKDEPFLVDRVIALWRAHTQASAMDRLTWLRCLMRAGEVDDVFVELLKSMATRPDFVPALNDLHQIAMQDASREPQAWQDRLAPETLRLAAMAKALMGNTVEASTLAITADAMYAKTGDRLRVARAAGLHEQVRYRLAADPFADIDGNLKLLARCDAILGGTGLPGDALAGPPGQTRMRVLLAAGREDEARLQIQKLGVKPEDHLRRLGLGCAEVALFAAGTGRNIERGLALARRAVEAAPDVPACRLALIHLLLAAGEDREVLAAARIAAMTWSGDASLSASIRRLKSLYPASAAWKELEMEFPRLFAAPTSAPTTQP